MKQSISILFISLIAANLIVQIQATNGCSLFGHACYGGHGKRSVGLNDETRPGNAAASAADTILQMYPNDDKDFQQYPRYRIMKIIRQMMEGKRLRAIDRMNNDMEYQASNEI